MKPRTVRLLNGVLLRHEVCRYRYPPAMYSVSPVIQRESSEAKKTAAGPMSSGWPIRPSGVCDSSNLRTALSPAVVPADVVPSVSTRPGLIELTRMLRGPSSLASDRVTASTAALVALYTEADAGASVATT